MMCYKDTTFCCSPNCQNACGRKLTPEIEAAADRWWTSGGGKKGEAPIAMSYFCGGGPEVTSHNINAAGELVSAPLKPEEVSCLKTSIG